MKIIKVAITKTYGVRGSFIFTEQDKIVHCAYDQKRDCSPECAACEQVGQKLHCNRNGGDSYFIIGPIKETT